MPYTREITFKRPDTSVPFAFDDPDIAPLITEIRDLQTRYPGYLGDEEQLVDDLTYKITTKWQTWQRAGQFVKDNSNLTNQFFTAMNIFLTKNPDHKREIFFKKE